jgi:hypothetical protein
MIRQPIVYGQELPGGGTWHRSAIPAMPFVIQLSKAVAFASDGVEQGFHAVVVDVETPPTGGRWSIEKKPFDISPIEGADHVEKETIFILRDDDTLGPREADDVGGAAAGHQAAPAS